MADQVPGAPAGAGRLMAGACAGMFVFGLVMAVLGAVLPGLFDKIGFDKAAAGDLFLVMNFAMLAMTLLFGPLVDRFGFKAFLVLCSILVAAAFGLLTLASTYTLVVVAAIVLGFGGGGLNGGTNALTSDIHEAEKRGSALNLLGVFFGIGAVTIPFLIGFAAVDDGPVEHPAAGRRGESRAAAAVRAAAFSGGEATARLPAPGRRTDRTGPSALALRKPAVLSIGQRVRCGWLALDLPAGVLRNARQPLRLSPWPGTGPPSWSAGSWRAESCRLLGNSRLVLLSAALALVGAIILRFTTSSPLAVGAVLLVGFGFAAIYPTTLASVGNAFAALSGTAFGVVIAVSLVGGMISPWLVGQSGSDSRAQAGTARSRAELRHDHRGSALHHEGPATPDVGVIVPSRTNRRPSMRQPPSSTIRIASG